jgi:hypothetical protein
MTTSSLKAGTHTIKASYAGDATFRSSAGTVKQTVNLYATTTTLISGLNPSVYGQAVTLTASVASAGTTAPTGTVTSKNGTTSLGSAAVSAGGTATLTTANLAAGTLELTAQYNGDSTNAKSTSAPLTLTVSQAQVTLTLSSTPDPSTAGKPVKLKATFASTGGLPKGTVTFSNGATILGTATIANGVASFSTTALPQGSDVVTASYSGTADYSAASGTVTQQVN